MKKERSKELFSPESCSPVLSGGIRDFTVHGTEPVPLHIYHQDYTHGGLSVPFHWHKELEWIDLIEGFQTDFDKTKLDTGVRKWTWFVKNGNGTDGTPYDVSQYKVKETRQVAMNHFGENDRWDTAEFTGLAPAGSTPDGLKWQKIQDIYDQEYPKIVNADSHDAAMEEYDKMISEMNDAGLEDVEKVITQNYQERMKLWNE